MSSLYNCYIFVAQIVSKNLLSLCKVTKVIRHSPLLKPYELIPCAAVLQTTVSFDFFISLGHRFVLKAPKVLPGHVQMEAFPIYPLIPNTMMQRLKLYPGLYDPPISPLPLPLSYLLPPLAVAFCQSAHPQAGRGV